MNRDRLGDLVCFEPSQPWQDKQAFLAEALARLERGEHVYTYVDGGRLLHSGWLIDRQAKGFMTEVQQEYHYPEGSSVLYDFYTHPECRGRGLYQACVQQMLGDVAALPGTRFVYISALSRNHASIHVIEKLGFQLVCTLSRRRLLGWQMMTAAVAAQKEY